MNKPYTVEQYFIDDTASNAMLVLDALMRSPQPLVT